MVENKDIWFYVTLILALVWTFYFSIRYCLKNAFFWGGEGAFRCKPENLLDKFKKSCNVEMFVLILLNYDLGFQVVFFWHCYGLNIILVNFTCLIPLVIAFADGTCGRQWGYNSEALINGTSALIKETQERYLVPSTIWGYNENTAI